MLVKLILDFPVLFRYFMEMELIRKMIIGMMVFIIAGTIHEFAHALSALILGDDTARKHGRLTLNPIVHIDLFGSILFPIIGAFSGFYI